MENLGRVNEGVNRGYQELYKCGDDYYVVSTVADLANNGLRMDEKAIVDLAGVFAGYETTGEETIVFNSDKHGHITNWSEEILMNGENSRQRAIDELETLDA